MRRKSVHAEWETIYLELLPLLLSCCHRLRRRCWSVFSHYLSLRYGRRTVESTIVVVFHFRWYRRRGNWSSGKRIARVTLRYTQSASQESINERYLCFVYRSELSYCILFSMPIFFSRSSSLLCCDAWFSTLWVSKRLARYSPVYSICFLVSFSRLTRADRKTISWHFLFVINHFLVDYK